MPLCATACAVNVPSHSASECGVTTRKGGLGRLIFMKCDEEFVDITDLAEWTTKIAADEVHSTGELMGSKPQGSFEKKKVSSCEPERVVAGQKQLDFADYNADNVAFGEYTFWNTIMTNQSKYQVAWLTCEGLLYAWIPSFALEVDDQVEEDGINGTTFISGNIVFHQTLMTVPQLVPGLAAVLK